MRSPVASIPNQNPLTKKNKNSIAGSILSSPTTTKKNLYRNEFDNRNAETFENSATKEAKGWNVSDMFTANAKLTGRNYDYNGNPHDFGSQHPRYVDYSANKAASSTRFDNYALQTDSRRLEFSNNFNAIGETAKQIDNFPNFLHDHRSLFNAASIKERCNSNSSVESVMSELDLSKHSASISMEPMFPSFSKTFDRAIVMKEFSFVLNKTKHFIDIL
jgi:hypothetical protein